MKKVLDYIKKNTLFSVLLILFILIIILGIVAIKVFIFPSYHDSKYGNRLDGINDVMINDSRINDVLSKYDKKDGFDYKSYRLSGKIVNVYFDVTGDVSISDIKSSADLFVNGFSSDELSYYDFQVFVSKDDDCILIGYRKNNADKLSWNHVGDN